MGARYETTRLLIVGEASGEAEARESLPFRPYAQSGSLLSDAMREVHIERSEVAITNVLRCRPPGDWLDKAPWQFGAISNCTKNFLYETIERLKPKAILALGGTAAHALIALPKGKYGGLDYVRGYVHAGAGPAAGVPVVPSYHPAFIRRGAAHLTPLLQRDIRRAFGVATERFREGKDFVLDVANAGLRYQTSPSIDEAWEFAERVDPELPLSVDLETPKSVREDEEERVSFTDRDIKTIQFSQRRGEGIIFPWRDEYIDAARSILRKPTAAKFGHNWWAFDHEVLRSNGIDLPHEYDDTLVMFHYYWSDLPANLQAAAQSCGFLFPWKHFNDIDGEFYGVADVDAGLCVYRYMRSLLEREGMWESYRRYFAQVWPILQGMSRRGIPISEEKRNELKALIEREDLRVTAAIQEIVPPEIRSTKQKSGLKRNPKLECPWCGGEFRGDHECDTQE